jgi:hypothetical protein
MFRVIYYVDDRKLGESLTRLVGLAQGAPEVQPVTNAKAQRNGKIVATSGGSVQDQFLAHLREHNIATITSKVAAEFLTALGRSRSNSTALLQRLSKAGALKRLPGKRGKGNPANYTIAPGAK